MLSLVGFAGSYGNNKERVKYKKHKFITIFVIYASRSMTSIYVEIK